MIVVRVELWSARTGKRTELARMKICNDGEITSLDPAKGSYLGETYVGRDTEALSRGIISRTGRVPHWPRQALHVWNLVATMLEAMGYTKRPAASVKTPLSLQDALARLYAQEEDVGLRSVWDAGWVAWRGGTEPMTARERVHVDTPEQAAAWLWDRLPATQQLEEAS